MEKKSELLSEELKRYKRLVEYTFYVDEDDDDLPVAGSNNDKNKELILQADPEGDPDVGGNPANPADAAAANPGEDEAPVDVQVNGADGGEQQDGDMTGQDGMGDAPAEPAMPAAEVPMPEPPPSDEVEIDITQLVQGTEEAKQMAQANGQKMEELLSKFNELAGSFSKMDILTKEMDNLKHEVEKRNPTPQEKLEMRSLDSYPYNLKLTDFWAEKEGNYDVMGTDDKPKEKEYVLTQDDLNSDFSHGAVKKSFDEYEEEDI